MRKAHARRLGDTAVILGLVVFTAWTLLPVLWLMISTLYEQRAMISSPPDLSFANLTMANLSGIWNNAGFLRGLGNSLIVAGFSTGVALALGAPAAYALARLGVARAEAISLVILATQMVPGIAISIPLFIAISSLGLIDSKAMLIVVYLSFNLPIVIWILRGFFAGLPPGLERAAAIDGAGPVRTFVSIILPISMPPLCAAAIFAFIEAWNEFFFALILTRQTSQTIPLVIGQFAGQYMTAFGQMMSAAAVSCLPVILLAVLGRNYIVRGFSDGIVKG